VTDTASHSTPAGAHWLPTVDGRKILQAVRFRLRAEARQHLPYVSLANSATYAIARAVAQVLAAAVLVDRGLADPDVVRRKAIDALHAIDKMTSQQGYGDAERAEDVRAAEQLLRRLSRLTAV
jgi:lactam utilization protein B